MAEFARFNNQTQLDSTKVSVKGAAADAGRGGDIVANSLNKVSQSVQSQANEYMEEASLSIAGTQYNKALTTATLAMAEAKQKRYESTVDEKGNPSYNSLIKDMETIGTEIMNKASSKIIMSDARDSFRMKFAENITNELVLAGQETRKQQIGFARAGLDEGINALREAAINDNPSNVGIHEQSLIEMLDTQLAGGSISPEERGELLRQSTQDIRKGQWRKRIDGNPVQALANLEGATPEDFGLLQSNYLTLKREAMAGVTRKQSADRASIRNQDAMATQLAISSTLDSDGNVGEFDAKDINSHYQQTVQSIQQETQQQPSIGQKAQVAMNYGVAVKSFSSEVKYSLKSGNLQQAAETIVALSGLSEDPKGQAVVQDLDDDSAAVFAYASSLLRAGGVAPGEAVRLGREAVFDADDPVKQERAIAFKQVKDFQYDRLSATVKDMWDEGLFDLEADTVADGVTATMGHLLKAAYMQTGDTEAAKHLVKTKYGKNFGVSELSGEEVIMLMPPEKVFPEATPEAIKMNLLEDVIYDLPEGIDTDAVTIESGQLTLLDPNNPAYSVFYVGVDGLKRPLTDEQGDSMLWSPDRDRINQQSRQDAVIDQAVEVAQAEALRASAREGFNPKKFGRMGPMSVFNNLYNMGVKIATEVDVRTGSSREQGQIKELQTAELELAKARATGDSEKITEAVKDVVKKREVVGANPNITTRQNLGSIASKYESRRNPTAYNPEDGQGGSYGEYQMNGGTLDKFLASSQFGGEFNGLEKGTVPFLARWRELAYNPEFRAEQKEFILDGSFAPARRSANNRGVPVSEALDEAIYSMSVQHPPKKDYEDGRKTGYRRVIDAAKATNPKNESEWLTALYNARIDMYPAYSNRYRKELQDVRRLLGGQ